MKDLIDVDKSQIFTLEDIPFYEISDSKVMEKQPLVSVHMITYNHVPYITQAIEGVLMQKTNFPIELVIGEDCSTDGTREIVLEYQKKYPDIIRVITADINVGMKKNSYRTFKACRGKYVAFCEGDDYWHHPEKLQKQVDYMESHPECGLVYTDFDVYNIRNKMRIKNIVKYKNWPILKNPTIIDFVNGKKYELSLGILTCTVMSRKNLLERVIENDPFLHKNTLFLMGDTQLWAELICLKGINYINESTATHNILIESATRSEDIKKILRFQMSGIKMYLYLCEKYNLPIDLKQRFEKHLINCLLRLAFYEGNKRLAENLWKFKKIKDFKDYLKYFGIRYRIIFYGMKPIIFLKNKFSREKELWSI